MTFTIDGIGSGNGSGRGGRGGTARGLALGGALTVLASVALATAGGAAQAAPAAPVAPTALAAPATPDVGALRAQVRNGTLLAGHGVRTMCAARCHADVVTAGPRSRAPLSTGSPVGLGATDLARAYALPPASAGRRGTIALITAGADPHLESDLAVYRRQYGLPACTTHNGCLTITDYHGGPALTPGATDEFREAEEDWAVESSLDVDMASAACPGCRITVVQTPDIDATGEPTVEGKAADYATAYLTAVRLGADAVSLSDMLVLDSATADAGYSTALRRPGVPLFSSIGDVAPDAAPAGAPVPRAATAEDEDSYYTWPADLPWTVGVGGTSLKPLDAARTRFTETAWHNLTGECATALPPAAGQPANVAAHCGGHRAATDVSAVADPASGPAVYDSYAPFTGAPQRWIVSGGTSASSPFTAAWYVRGSGHVAGSLGPGSLYRAPASVFHDVTADGGSPDLCRTLGWDPAVCQAGPGWDGPTGLGSPHGLGAF